MQGRSCGRWPWAGSAGAVLEGELECRMSEAPPPRMSSVSLGGLTDPAEGVPGSLVIYSLSHSLIDPYTPLHPHSFLPSFLHHLVTKPLLWAGFVLRTQMRSLPL